MRPTTYLIFFLFSVLLAIFTITLTLSSRTLSLPTPSLPLSTITTLLPFLSLLSQHFPALQSPLFYLITILTTLHSSNLASARTGAQGPGSPPCSLEARWAKMYSAHDADGIRRIQDALDCCGLRSTKDRYWPFPHGGPPAPPQNPPKKNDPGQCATQFKRSQSCLVPWSREMKRVQAGELGAVLAVGVVQVLLWALTAIGNKRKRNNNRAADVNGNMNHHNHARRPGPGEVRGRGWNWKDLVDKIFAGGGGVHRGHGDDDDDDVDQNNRNDGRRHGGHGIHRDLEHGNNAHGARRGLLTAVDEEDDDDEEEEDGRGDHSNVNGRGARDGGRTLFGAADSDGGGYGTTDGSGPRVEVSHFERGPWE
ncbi:hypothetical protein QBC42DRAFT_262968 [Cladorrhinum samala]|uniref:Tetraspanin Tsp3 n=1 Tax=Cladorrhinum samala TaxID=585594 RepID=A0AAV9HV97_9PEZI|nr:hypothetical protein QBC42DRAFT_262968 [Cladorrhinum samala]